MAIKWIEDLGSTLGKIKLGLTGVVLKNNSGNLLVRNSADTADAEIQVSKLNTTAIDLNSNSSLTALVNDVIAGGAGGVGKIITVKSGPTLGSTALSGTAPLSYNSGTGAFSISAATTSAAGTLSASDKTKLDGIASGATANQTDAFLLNRANHTGTRAIAFTYQSGSTLSLGTLAANTTVLSARIFIQTAFNGSTATTLRIGDATVNDRLMLATLNDPSAVGEYESRPVYTYTSSTAVNLTIALGTGVTQGSGYILLET